MAYCYQFLDIYLLHNPKLINRMLIPHLLILIDLLLCSGVQGGGFQTPAPRNSEVLTKSNRIAN